ncbi:chitobiase/beta-hexosaminidase C-terminal domain-containing protein [Prevotella communis]|uniref:chitobiase/beta-hexosaminidase C-terminal domain-containing protein n=1 Tax=Prevotella communis TaxID=2913614 RepID=UPI001ED9DE56|nr:chitobiase/beta-hexosaminidase C-terminal domain-containing protein [Prevotella communis]UKK63094.1 chitobiase/beta-hexosaminidase C-terminal domain-containing protein [Prevotella communis]UKK65919.1 chitobiase/beta-hexosaminidase C-terminal domain-containing protein [Prevotella communis]
MKKFFTLALALMGFAGVANAANVDDLAVLKHSYVLVCEDLGARPGKGALFGDGHFLDVTGGSTATNKGSVDLSVADGVLVTEAIANKYGEYGKHLNFLRLKKTQDVIAMKVTAKSKVIIFYQDNNKDDRYPVFAKDAALTEKYADGVRSERCSGEEGKPAVNVRRMEWTATDDGLVYVGDNNGDMFVSYIIIEANEAPGTPTVKVGEQTYEGGLWFREVTCKANDYTMEGTEIGIPTIVTYTTDGTAPTAASPIYQSPIKCYKDMTVKFQAFYDIAGTGTPDAGCICDNADNEANVNFLFDAPTIEANGAQVTITSPYEGAKNFVLINGDNEEETSSITLEESATVTAYSKIINGDYAEFTTKSTTKDVYVLNPIKEKKTIAVTTGTAVIDEEATATSTTGPVYKVEGGAISADKKDFFVKNLTFSVLKDEKAQYQVPEGQEIYIQMSNTNITFQVAEGDSVDVKVVCTKNSCKNLEAEDAAADKLVNGCTPDRSCYVNVSGTNYCHLDADGGVAADLKLHSEANVITFGLHAGTYTFQKYSGTGNILISSIEITPVEVDKTGISTVKNEVAKSAIFNLAGQKVTSNFKGIIVKDGKKIFK